MMKVLVAVASKHGSAKEVGKDIAQVLEQRGLEVVVSEPQEVQTLAGFDAIVVGSSVYLTAWLDSARDFVSRFSAQLRELPVWAFSVGLSGVPKGSVQDPSKVGPALLQMQPLDYQTFPGKLDTTKLNLRERTIARWGGATEGDFRDFEDIERWANQIADHLLK